MTGKEEERMRIAFSAALTAHSDFGSSNASSDRVRSRQLIWRIMHGKKIPGSLHTMTPDYMEVFKQVCRREHVRGPERQALFNLFFMG